MSNTLLLFVMKYLNYIRFLFLLSSTLKLIFIDFHIKIIILNITCICQKVWENKLEWKNRRKHNINEENFSYLITHRKFWDKKKNPIIKKALSSCLLSSILFEKNILKSFIILFFPSHFSCYPYTIKWFYPDIF